MKRYEKYKPSGIDWIGEIPEHWNIKKFKSLYRSGMGATILKTDLVEDGIIPVFSATQTDVIFGYINKVNLVLEPGDLVIPARGNSIGFVTMVNEISTCTQTTIYSKRISNDFNYRFLLLYLIGLKDFLFQFDQTAIPQITVEQIKDNPVLVPSLEEQTAIANYLDEKTALIDKFIAGKQKLIELLKEERAAVINEAVSGKGKNWERKKLKYVSYLKARVGWHGLKADEFTVDEKQPYCVTGTDFINGLVDWKNCYHISEERYCEDPFIQLKEDDLLVTKDGTIGKVAIVKNLRNKASLNSGIFVMRPLNNSYNSTFMYWLIQSNVFDDFIKYISRGSTIIHLYQDTFLNWSVLFPPLKEQTQIVEHIQAETQRIDDTISKIEKEIELMQEYRTALINEVVTGKIKVV